jgi:hypothetical protein
MIILLTVIAVVITGVPLAGVALVTLASRREETARSIAGRAPGPLERAARRLLAFHATGIGHPSGRARVRHEGWDPGHPPRDARIPAGRTAPAPADPVPAPADPVPAPADPVPALADPALADPALADPAPPDDMALAT